MSNREELIAIANDLSLDFPGNISNIKLQALVDEAKGPATKPDEGEGDDEGEATNTIEDTVEVVKAAAPKSKKAKLRQRISEAKRKASKNVVVTITNKDPRENSTAQTVHLSVENEHFSLSRIVPLDIACEIPECLADLASSTMMTLYKDEIVEGKRTGNKVSVSVQKFVVSYGKPKE